MSRALIFFLSIVLLPSTALTQDSFRGTPYITNFTKSDYSAGTQNWGISQDERGFMYFANNDGLLTYNGVSWNLSKVSSSSPLRSILVDSRDRIFLGLINDFGVMKFDDSKPSSFHSLKDLLPNEHKEFNDIWRIHESESGIVFQCQKYIFIYSDDKIKVIEADNRFHFSYKLGSRIIVQDIGVGLLELVDGQLVKLAWWKENLDLEISSILEADENSILIGTTDNGVYILEGGLVSRWDAPVNELITDSRLYTATRLSNNRYAFGTVLNGLIISDKEGNKYNSLNTDIGIQNNTILSVYVDKSENLWLGLDNGIDFIEITSPISYLGANNIGTGYCCKVFEGNLYLGTNQGLYVKQFNSKTASSNFVLVENTAGQVWTLEEFEGQLFCGHNNGTYLIKGNIANKICDIEGAWKFITLKDNPDLIVGGHYKGLVLYRRQNNNQWEFFKEIEGFEVSSRYLFQDNDNDLWVGHSGRGLYKIRINTSDGTLFDFLKYDAKHGLPTSVGNIPFMYNENVYVSTNDSIYKYEKLSNSFKTSKSFNSIFENSGRIKYLVEGNNGETWFIADRESGVIIEGYESAMSKVTVPFNKLNDKYVNEFEFIYPYNDENVFLGLEEGFAHFSASYSKFYDEDFATYITKVEMPYIDSAFFPRSAASEVYYKLPYKKNFIRFHFAAPFYENEELLEFSYLLTGYSDEWSDWSSVTYKDYTNLHEGAYVFKLKSRNIFGVEGDMASINIEIFPPWYRSTPAYLIYTFCIVILVLSIIKYLLFRIKLINKRQGEKYMMEIKQREEKYQKMSLIAEKEIIDLKNEKLRSEMTYMDKELVNQTMAIIEKNKFLKRVREDLTGVQDYVVAEAARNKIHSIIERIKKEIDIKYQNKIFEKYFDEANEEFFKLIKQKHPDLTPYDLRLCAFIRMNISTKEIATILNITYRGAEVSRYRLRKKMDLPREINLSSYLASF